jgi:hypothetical protein
LARQCSWEEALHIVPLHVGPEPLHWVELTREGAARPTGRHMPVGVPEELSEVLRHPPTLYRLFVDPEVISLRRGRRPDRREPPSVDAAHNPWGLSPRSPREWHQWRERDADLVHQDERPADLSELFYVRVRVLYPVLHLRLVPLPCRALGLLP